MTHDNDELALFDALGVGHLAREKNLNAWLSFIAADTAFIVNLAGEVKDSTERTIAKVDGLKSTGRYAEG